MKTIDNVCVLNPEDNTMVLSRTAKAVLEYLQTPKTGREMARRFYQWGQGGLKLNMLESGLVGFKTISSKTKPKTIYFRVERK